MAKKNLKMTTFKDKHVSKRKIHMRVLTFIIAMIVIIGLVVIFPFESVV